MKNNIIIFITILMLFISIVSTGCVENKTGCLPVVIKDKQVKESSNIRSLLLTIGDGEYNYYNPSLTTYSDIEINHTYDIRFVPMVANKPYVELCK